MGRYFESVVLNNVQGTGLQITPTLMTWTESITFFSVFPDDIDTEQLDLTNTFLLMYAYENIPDMVKVGDPHYAFGDAYAIATSLEPQTPDSTTHIMQKITY